jgi:hypothetical protein
MRTIIVRTLVASALQGTGGWITSSGVSFAMALTGLGCC